MQMNKIHTEQGMTIVEVMVAIVILGITFVALTSLVATSTTGNVQARNMERASLLAQQKLEELRMLPVDHALLVDTDGDGTDQDANNNGKDDGDETAPPPNPLENFGLDDIGAAADHFEMDQENIYTISWNIAVGEPSPNTLTIRVIASRSELGIDRSVRFDLMRVIDN